MIYDPAVNLKRSWNFSFYFKHLGKQCFWNIYQRLKKGKQKSGNWKMRNETKRNDVAKKHVKLHGKNDDRVHYAQCLNRKSADVQNCTWSSKLNSTK